MGIHMWDIPPHDMFIARRWNYVNMALYNPILALVKSSVLIFLLRLGGTKRPVWWCIHVLNVANICLMIGTFFGVLLQCLPIHSNWDPTVPEDEKTCVDGKALTVGTAIITIITDVLVLALPFWIFLELKMARRVKIALLGVFMLGIVVTIVGCIRLWSILDVFRQFETGNIDPDLTYSLGPTTSVIESNVAIVTASVPALWPLFRQWFPNAFAKLGGTYGTGPSGDSSYSKKGSRKLVTIGGSGHKTLDDNSFVMKPIRGIGRTEIRSYTPSGSEEEIMRCDAGIMRTTNVEIGYEPGDLTGDRDRGIAR
ncbi:hypothetical protein SODALDRAFT_64905 [Sodiomyces alkalinus F11]|uniref:Rhodopsin domain-containing protein n=1 Tax=Sodiomyces alkalinus (strain CBS 110278 / VKM F-3762 / F11) TaxID=1314773 RepID=A0A3N2PLX0_SODAK|nr:hypothetical protein SODALDRAFT_64905 [Sodiomyces alkalinus F11]ROT35394.1 hypothetical protein SODALDRAFT_64905 [Sodiomyces alkalinus F11]